MEGTPAKSSFARPLSHVHSCDLLCSPFCVPLAFVRSQRIPSCSLLVLVSFVMFLAVLVETTLPSSRLSRRLDPPIRRADGRTRRKSKQRETQFWDTADSFNACLCCFGGWLLQRSKPFERVFQFQFEPRRALRVEPTCVDAGDAGSTAYLMLCYVYSRRSQQPWRKDTLARWTEISGARRSFFLLICAFFRLAWFVLRPCVRCVFFLDRIESAAGPSARLFWFLCCHFWMLSL